MRALTKYMLGGLGLFFISAPLWAAAALPDTTQNIHLGLINDTQVLNVSALAGKVDYIYAASTTSTPPSGIYIDGYLTYDRDDSNESLSWFQANHPSWIVYTCSDAVAYEFGNPNVPIDITNSAVQQYQEQEVTRSFSAVPPGFTFNGVAWDNIVTLNWIPRCKTLNGSSWNTLYSGAYVDSVFTNSIVSWAANMYSMMQSEHPGKGMTMNVSTGPTGYSSPEFEQISGLFPYVDMIVDERGFTAYGNGPIKDADWENEVSNLESLNAQNKGFFVVNEWNGVPNDASITHAQINWSLANYLLVKGQHSFVYIYPLYNGVQGYGNFYDRPEYHVSIGEATNARYTYEGVQRRDYSGGTTLVNPSSTESYTVTLPSTYKDLWGNDVSSITLAPATAEVLLSTTTAPAPTPLSIVSVTPQSGSGNSETLSVSLSDPSGYGALSSVNVLINSTLNSTDACWIRYYPSELELSYDNTASWQAPMAFGANASEQNNECSISAAGASVTGSGNTLTLKVPITYQSSWTGAKNIYVYAHDSSGNTVSYTAEGTWTVQGGSSSPTSLSILSVTPQSGSGLTQTFTASISDPNGYESVYGVHILINSTLNGTNACWIQYYPSTNAVQLSNDNTPTSLVWQPAMKLGTELSEENSECSINAADMTTSGSGDTFTLTIPITFQNTWAGAKNVYVHAQDKSGATVGYDAEGTWTVP